MNEDDRAGGHAEISNQERLRRMRGRNRVTLGVLLGLMVLFYLITIVRMGQ